MKVGEHAVFLARLKGLTRHEALVRLKEWFTRFGIEDWWNKRVEDLSKGMAQKVQFIVTVLHEPKLLIFDEPFSGFDPINANLLKEEILRLRDKGATVIFSTHNMSSVEEICDHISLINKSKNILSGRVDEIRRSYGDNIFAVQYRGEQDVLQPLCKVCSVLESDYDRISGLTSAKIHIEHNDDVRSVIAAVNEAVELRSFTEIIPSMNNIFIRAVEGVK
jgi:ABC-2 type transport system ATP-binding protein